MKKILLILFLTIIYVLQISAYEKKSIVERYTNSQCGPCANLNNSWYNQLTQEMLAVKSISHLVYNVNWPSATDPMYLLNATDNSTRWRYYGISSVPWIMVNGVVVSTASSANLTSAVNSGNAQYSPFKMVLTPVKFSNKVINVKVKIFRDPADVTTFTKTKLKVAITEKTVIVSPALEPAYYSISRKMLPDGKGLSFDVPAPGDSVEMDLLYIPTQSFLQAVNFDSLRVVAFIQSDQTKEIYQSIMEDVSLSTQINSAFAADESLGAAPLTVQFTDYSTPSGLNSIISWQWDFNNDGTIDSQDPNPRWTFDNDQAYDVALTVSDGVQQYKRLLKKSITAVTASSDILVVNGIDYTTAAYVTEMTNFYNSSACFGNHQVDVWDLFGDQEFNYLANPNILKSHLFNRTIPNSILNLYDKVIWIGNNYSGDLSFYDPAQVLDYVQHGGNFLLATRLGSSFLNSALVNYCGIASLSGDLQVSQMMALDDSLVNMSEISANTLVHLVTLNTSSEAIPIFDDNVSTTWIAGFRMRKQNEGAFIYIAGRPYRYNNSASFTNYDYIIDNWLTPSPVGINDNDDMLPAENSLSQNYPNPFNPVTNIKYAVKNAGNVSIKIYNLVGETVAALVNELKQPGEYNISFDAVNLPSGIYLYRLETGEFSFTRKLILLK